MIQQIFHILPPQFFNVLSCTNQEVYADCLFLLFHYVEKGHSFGEKRELIIELLTDYFNKQEDGGINTPKEKALSVLRRLHQCGWIFYEEDANYEIYINFKDYCIPILKTLLDLKKEDELEYLGYIYMIYSALKNIDVSTLSDILDQIYHNTTIVLNKLKSLNANIKRYIQELLNKTTIEDLQSIVDNLFVNYKKNIIDCHYQRLKTSDNISKYRPYIISKLNQLSLNDELINQISSDLINKKRFTDISDAKAQVYEQIEFIIRSFESIDAIMDEIDKKNTKYIQMSVAKILFIVSNKEDLQGKLNQILRYYVDEKRLNFNCDLFHITPQKFFDTHSLYTMPNRTNVIEKQLIESEKVLTNEEKNARLNAYLDSNLYSKKKIDDFVLERLKHQETIQASALPLANFLDYAKIILIYMYSSSDVSYWIEKNNILIKKEGFLFYDFKIRRK